MAAPAKTSSPGDASSKTPPPGAFAREEMHEFVQRLLGSWQPGRVLDVPAGRGALSWWMRERGFDVVAADLYPRLFEVPGIEIHQVNLNQGLPFADAQFDYVLCIEGLEHTENPHRAVKEFGRVVKPGGQVIISVPNVLNIEERVKTLLHGYTSHFKPITREQVLERRIEFAKWRSQGELDELFLHVTPIGYPQLRYMLESNGFESVEVFRGPSKPNQWLYFPLVAFIRLLGAMRPKAQKQRRWTSELQSDAILMGGNSIVVRARRC